MVTDTQADLTQRARTVWHRIADGNMAYAVTIIAAALQSEREAAEERLEIEAGEAYERGVQSGLKLCEAAAAGARRAALEEAACLCDAEQKTRNLRAVHPLPGDDTIAPFTQDMVQQSKAMTAHSLARSIRALASPAPQEDGR